MRLITRSDFDGLACAVFLAEAGVIDSWKFVHPKDLQDGLFEVDSNDCLANVPFVEGCALWFDHHSSEEERKAYLGKFTGDCRKAPSAAHVVYDYYGGKERFPNFDDLLDAVDKVDSGQLTVEEILNPTGWVLLGFIMDPRTGLGRFQNFKISNYALMEEMIQYCRTKSITEILELQDVKERVEMYLEQTKLFDQMIKDHTVVKDQVIITDLRGVDTIYTGNRFYIYSMYPEANISVWIVDGKGKQGCSAAVGKSIINRNSPVDVGSLMLKYNGGGHKQVGTCQFNSENMASELPKMLDELIALNRG